MSTDVVQNKKKGFQLKLKDKLKLIAIIQKLGILFIVRGNFEVKCV